MSLILNIETATTVCSVSVSKDTEIVSWMELDAGFTHAENLHLFIEECLTKAGVTVSDLSAIAVSRGPGSYTGLRIGVSTAKGLAYALKKPLISVDTLQIMAVQAAGQAANNKAVYCPMIDARRMEVYSAVYEAAGEMKEKIEAVIVQDSTLSKYEHFPEIYFFGDGMNKCRELLSKLKGARFLDGIKPSARFMPFLSNGRFVNSHFENVANFEPFYLKDFLPGVKKNLV